MIIIVFAIILVTFSSCQTSEFAKKEYEENPCQDVEYQILKKKKVSELTESELKYLNAKERECENYTSNHTERISEKKEAQNNLKYILIGLGVIAVIGLIITIYLNGHKPFN